MKIHGMNGKNMLMEDNISGQENGLGFKIGQFISLNTIWITKEDTRRGSRIKFRSIPKESRCKTKTT